MIHLFRRSALIALFALLLAPTAHTAEWTLTNPLNKAWENEPVRLKVAVPDSAKADQITVKADGKPVPFTIDTSEGRRWIWVAANLEAGASVKYTVTTGQASDAKALIAAPKRNGNHYELTNGLIRVKVPATATGDAIPAPIAAIKSGDGPWIGQGHWNSSLKLKKLVAIEPQGGAMAKITLRYEFEGTGGVLGDTPAFAEIDIALLPGRRHVTIAERHAMRKGDYWEFETTAGFKATQCRLEPFSAGPSGQGPRIGNITTLKAGQTRMGDTHLLLVPRWNQAFDDGWLAYAHDDKFAIGAIPARAGRWFWPHDNKIAVKVKSSGDYMGLRCPTWKGRRYWFLIAGPIQTWDSRIGTDEKRDNAAKSYITNFAFRPLDKLVHDYVLEWPGLDAKKKGGFAGLDFYSGSMNPTGGWRGYGKGEVRSAGRPGNLSTLSRMQVIFDPDAYGNYWLYWSPENPNFFSDFVKPGIAQATRLKSHPRFKEFAKYAEMKLREDVYHSVTMPGGAGQECPGYQYHGYKQWSALAPICRTHLGFDPTKWPRFKATESFLLHVSQPIGGGERRSHPGGDTHPLGPPISGSVKGLTTEELPGFGVVFRNNAGSPDKETYLAFKSGPNRGHYHGDQLSFHYCAFSQPAAVDHMCSYAPRPGQEHMHNRVTFFTEDMPYANMDGYERVIAFKPGKEVDIAVGQVESDRLRRQEKTPPEVWDQRWDVHRFDKPLKYRRTIVMVKDAKGEGHDFFVIRDQWEGPKVKAAYCLHALTGKRSVETNMVKYGNMTLAWTQPSDVKVVNFDWGYERKNIKEHTLGVRLETPAKSKGEYITVIHPGGKAPDVKAVDGGVTVNGVTVTFAGDIDAEVGEKYNSVTVMRGSEHLAALPSGEIDLDRSQGEVGLFIPDAGYPFGDIPEWLIKQRRTDLKKPDWYVPFKP